MASQLTDDLNTIFRSIVILSPTSFSFAGRTVATSDLAGSPLAGVSPQANPLVAQLQQHLYQYCYVQRFTGRLPEPPPATGNDSLAQDLSAANASREHWDAGWLIYQIMPSGQIFAYKQGLVRMLWPGEFFTHQGPGIAPQIGASISVYLPRESLTLQPGFYFAFGETAADHADDLSLLRLYWNIRPDGAPTLVRALTQRLNQFQAPFRLKCPTSRSHYVRLDAAVLYIPRRLEHIVSELVTDVYDTVRAGLAAGTPLFTRRVADGLALAEDPGGGESFGMSRCRILAEGIWNAYQQGFQTPQARLQAVASLFAQYGLSLERPYLNPGAHDRYHIPIRSSGART